LKRPYGLEDSGRPVAADSRISLLTLPLSIIRPEAARRGGAVSAVSEKVLKSFIVGILVFEGKTRLITKGSF
jgi:hypothetical protein